jgi:soluble lytic murein transglycosylase-like protein
MSAVIAAQYLRTLKQYFDTWPKAVMAYNCGISRVEEGNIPDSTYEYLINVFN